CSRQHLDRPLQVGLKIRTSGALVQYQTAGFDIVSPISTLSGTRILRNAPPLDSARPLPPITIGHRHSRCRTPISPQANLKAGLEASIEVLTASLPIAEDACWTGNRNLH